jgi:hypothetical protein
MEATKLVTRDVYEIAYENSTGSGTITATFTNPENGDKSVYKGADDGKFIVTVEKDYQGTDAVTVAADENGETLDSGTVSFG